MEGKTPELSIQQAHDLLDSIDVSNVVGLRDRAVLGVLGVFKKENPFRAEIFRKACTTSVAQML